MQHPEFVGPRDVEPVLQGSWSTQTEGMPRVLLFCCIVFDAVECCIETVVLWLLSECK